ncbi:MAG: hypothetical protein KAS32_16595 [Candidatus Peribacteraceae bacterium]|nr:hypothetical protein [Candidatus Peribacteraceae bacterium]
MKYAWIEDITVEQNEVPVLDGNGDPVLDLEGLPETEMVDVEIHGNGRVVGLNRGAQEGEIGGTITPQDLTKGMINDWYKVVNYVFTVKTEEEKATEDEPVERDLAYNEKMSDIDGMNRIKNSDDFVYANVVDEPHNYVADLESIQAVTIECMGMTDTDPIPVPNGVWKTNDVLEDGVTPVYIPYTVSEFISFKTSFFTRSSDNFGVKETHKNNLGAIYTDPESTIDDIKNYDITQGWY